MPRDIEEELFLSLEKYYGSPTKNIRRKYEIGYKYKCRICIYIKNYQKSWSRFSELYAKHSK